VSATLAVAPPIRLADLMAAGPRSSDDLSTVTGTTPDALYRLMRALASAGVLHEAEGRLFSLTPLGECLCSDAPESVHGWAVFIGAESHWRAWGALEHSVRTGESAFEHVNGLEPWAYRAQHPDAGLVFDRAMASMTTQVSGSILDVYDFGQHRTIVDVGGNNGRFLGAVLAAYPAMQGVVFDLEHVVAGAGPVLAAAGVADRCRVVAGSFFDSVPTGGDAYLLKMVLHDWNDEQAVAILKTCRRAATEGTALLVIEREVGPPNERLDSKLGDLNMLVGPGGRERTIAEFATLFQVAGFAFSDYTPGKAGAGVYRGVAT
jgi:hypothetical protein